MTLTCTHCGKPIDVGDKSWTGDTLTCPHCGGAVEVAKAGTYVVERTTNIPELSPSILDMGDARPIRLEVDQVLPDGTLIGQYRLQHLLGKGGMGSVYKAVHTQLSRDVAIKILPPDLARDPEFVKRFKREAMALAKLQHANIVAVHDMGVQGEIYYFVMEFIDGVNLRVLMHEKRLTPEQALVVVPKLCEALEYAHNRGIVHRDIKPENIMLDREGTPKIADFGLAKILRGDSQAHGLTQTNIVMGTLDYMAPEQREAARAVDHRVDIYSMGVVLYEMLTGEVPIGKFDPPSRRAGVDLRLDDIVLKALEKDPDRRYQRATHLGGDVTHLLTNAAPALGAVAVVDLQTNKQLVCSQRRALGIEMNDGRVSLTAWDRPEVGLADTSECKAVEERGCAVLRFTGDGLLSVMVPRDLDIAVKSDEGDVIVNDASGRLTVNTSEGDIVLNRYNGAVTIHSVESDITARDLTTTDMVIDVKNGDVEIEGLKFRSGEGSIVSKTGNILITPDVGHSSFAYDLSTSKGMIVADAGTPLDVKPNHVYGRVQDGAARLRIVAEHGMIRLGRGPAGTRLPTFQEFWSRMPASFRDDVGKYVIVNVALLIFFSMVGVPFVSGIIAVFWGMALALKGWHLYNALPPEPIKPVEIAVKTAVGAAQVAAAAVVPDPNLPRLPAFVVFANVCVVLGVLSTLGSMVLHWIDVNAAAVGVVRHIADLHRGSFVLTAVIAGLAVVGFLFSVAAILSMMEAPGRLTGRAGAGFSLCASLILLIYALLVPGRHFQKIAHSNDFTASEAQAILQKAGISSEAVDVTWVHPDVAEAAVKGLHWPAGEVHYGDQDAYVRFVRKDGAWSLAPDARPEPAGLRGGTR